MLGAALTFFVLAVLAALIGFEVIATGFAAVAKIAFFLFLALAVLSLIGNFISGADRALS
ncbi:MAG: DUF1328 domain-containing protein [Chloroflexi bacterium]|nr:DUF1328 domain-containing protein [Chloroflexota bacterium]